MGRYANRDIFNLGLYNEEIEKKKDDAFRIERISIDRIIPNIKNEYSIEGIDELKFSIQHNGLKQNLEVTDNGNGTYSLLSGERRYTALKSLVDEGNEQFKLVPCLITDVSKSSSFLDENGQEILTNDDKEMWSIITTNSEGRQYTDADRAFQVRELKKIYTKLADNGIKLPGKMSQLIADELKISKAQVERINYVETHGTDDLKEKFNNGEISIGAANDVAHLSPAQQREILRNENVTSTTVKTHTEKKEKKKAQRKDTAILKENKQITLSQSSTFMKIINETRINVGVINSDFDINCDSDDFDLLMIYTKKLNRTLNDFSNFIKNLKQ